MAAQEIEGTGGLAYENPVRVYSVNYGREGSPYKNFPISPYFATKDEAMAFKAQAIRMYPQCKVIMDEWYTANNETERQEQLADLLSVSPNSDFVDVPIIGTATL
jgi:hypothetical protein